MQPYFPHEHEEERTNNKHDNHDHNPSHHHSRTPPHCWIRVIHFLRKFNINPTHEARDHSPHSRRETAQADHDQRETQFVGKIDNNKNEILKNLIKIGDVIKDIVNTLDNSFMITKSNGRIIFEKLRILIYKYKGFE